MERFHLELNFQSIRMRWFINVFAIVAAFVTVAAIAFSILFRSIYYERIEVLANDYSYEFYSLNGVSPASFEDSAITLAGQFTHKTKMEVQVMNQKGEQLVSTSGFLSNDAETQDFLNAKKSG